MADFAPPSGPPPPRVPEGWKAVWNDQYKEWFYVNLITKQTTWDKPTAPASGGHDEAPPGGPPPSYASGPNNPNVSDDKKRPLSSNNPYGSSGTNVESDEALARRLQAEENARRGGAPNQSADRGASDSYYGASQGQPQGQYGQPQSQYGQPQSQYGGHSPQPPGIQGGYPGAPSNASPYASAQADRGSGGGFLGKLKNKFGGSSQGQGGYGGQPGYGQHGYPQQGYGGGYPQQGGYGGYPQQHGYGGGMMGGGMMGPKKKPGMGVGGAAALGVGGGLLGGMLLADAMEDHDQNEYDQGYDAGGGGDDFGGGDF